MLNGNTSLSLQSETTLHEVVTAEKSIENDQLITQDFRKNSDVRSSHEKNYATDNCFLGDTLESTHQIKECDENMEIDDSITY